MIQWLAGNEGVHRMTSAITYYRNRLKPPDDPVKGFTLRETIKVEHIDEADTHYGVVWLFDGTDNNSSAQLYRLQQKL